LNLFIVARGSTLVLLVVREKMASGNQLAVYQAKTLAR